MRANDWVRKTFSFSKLTTYAQCPRKAFLKYVMREKEPGAEFFIKGRAVHKGQEEYNLAKIKGETLTIGQTHDVAVQTFKTELEKEGIKGAVDRFATEHRVQLEVFEKVGGNKGLTPVAGSVEAMFAMDLDVADEEGNKEEARLEGFVDVVLQDDVSGKVRVRDYKTGGRALTQKEAAGHMQANLYVAGAEADESDIVNFVSGGRQKATTKVTQPEGKTERGWAYTLGWIGETIQAFRQSLKTGLWPKCAPKCSWCSKSACGFYRTCYPEKNEDLGKVVQVVKLDKVGTLPTPSWRK